MWVDAHRWRDAIGGLVLFLVGSALAGAAAAREYPVPVPAPPFTQRSADAWINSAPLTWEQLRGKVVLLDFWTFGCRNCVRSMPWLNALEARLGPQGLAVVGVHTPEFEHEKARDAVERKMREFGITHPVMLDNDYAYWQAMANRYWPTFYLVDKQGRIRGHFIGETHTGDRRAQAIEQRITRLLGE